MAVTFFCWSIPVRGKGRHVRIGEDDYLFWDCFGRDCRGPNVVTFRTTLEGNVQERLDHYLRVDSIGGRGLLMVDEIRAASEQHIHDWCIAHLWLPEVRNLQ